MDWNEYFMNIALIVAKRSKDPNYKTGCVLVDEENQIISTGYNGMPNHPKADNDKLIDWSKSPKSKIIHAEMNALLKRTRNVPCIAYNTHEPCLDCLKHMVQAGVKRVYYFRAINDNPLWKDTYDDSQRLEFIKDYKGVVELEKLELSKNYVRGSEDYGNQGTPGPQ